MMKLQLTALLCSACKSYQRMLRGKKVTRTGVPVRTDTWHRAAPRAAPAPPPRSTQQTACHGVHYRDSRRATWQSKSAYKAKIEPLQRL